MILVRPLASGIARLLILLLSGMCCMLHARAQEDYRFEIGGGIGMTGYLGDANTANLYSHPGLDVEGVFRYLRSPRIAFKTQLGYGSLKGNAADMTDILPEGNDFRFSSSFIQAAEMFEFNFFNFGSGESYRKLKRISPYIAGGLGLTLGMAGGSTRLAFSIPFGAGVKFKLRERLNLGAEFVMAKTFGDRLDSPRLEDPHGIRSSFMKNTDWYSMLNITLTYEFSKRCAVCNYKE